MAAIVVSKTVSRWTGNECNRAGYMRALETGSETARKDLETMVLGLPHFEVYGTTDTNTAASPAIDLTAQGVVFPDGTQRLIVVNARVADNDGQGVIQTKTIVDGGSTPIVVTDSADADPLIAGVNGTPTAVISVSTANVILTAVGISAVPVRWLIEIWVGDALPLTYHS
jgi:hypothetical protein